MFLLDWDVEDRVAGLNPTPRRSIKDTDWPPVLGNSHLWLRVEHMNKNQFADEKSACMLHEPASWKH